MGDTRRPGDTGSPEGSPDFRGGAVVRISAVTVRQEPARYLVGVRRTIDFSNQFASFVASALAGRHGDRSGAVRAAGPDVGRHFQWVAEHGYTPAGPISYCYLNDTERPPAHYLTEMSVPVE